MLPGSAVPEEFERAFGQRLLPGQQVFLSPSGRVALYWLLSSLELEPGDEVITQAFNFSAVPSAIEAAGGRVRFVDLRPDTFELDPEQLQQAITPHTRAVILTHLYGMPVDLKPLVQICEDRGVTIIEDCAQAAGATYNGRPVGSFGAGSFFTFGPTKNFTLLAGGAAATGDPEMAARMAHLARRHPRVPVGESLKLAAKAAVMSLATHPCLFSAATFPALQITDSVGLDVVHKVMGEAPSRLSKVEQAPLPNKQMAAVGLAQMQCFERLNRARQRNGWYLMRCLTKLSGISLPCAREGSIFMSFPIYHPRRVDLARELQRRGVDTDLGFMDDCSAMELFAHCAAHCPQSSRAAREVLHLPIHPYLDLHHMDHVADALQGALRVVDR